jgi:hypothetical protein
MGQRAQLDTLVDSLISSYQEAQIWWRFPSYTLVLATIAFVSLFVFFFLFWLYSIVAAWIVHRGSPPIDNNERAAWEAAKASQQVRTTYRGRKAIAFVVLAVLSSLSGTFVRTQFQGERREYAEARPQLEAIRIDLTDPCVCMSGVRASVRAILLRSVGPSDPLDTNTAIHLQPNRRTRN